MINNSDVAESDKTNQPSVAKLNPIPPVKSDAGGEPESDVRDSKTKASHSSDKANISSVTEANGLLPDESQDHGKQSRAAADDENAPSEAVEVLLLNSADETPETSKSVIERSLEESVTTEVKSEEFKTPPSDSQNGLKLGKPVKACSKALQEYIRQKVFEDHDSSSEDSCNPTPCNGFVDEMAEEGEEDTPSEDSNAIPDHGESIGSSDSGAQDSLDDYLSSDSFICDDEEEDELLSGNEYDLGDERKKSKRSRIIDADLLGDDDIIKVSRKKEPVKKEPVKKRKRIVEMYDDSSSDDQSAQSNKTSEIVIITDSPPVVAEEAAAEDGGNTPKSGPPADQDVALKATSSGRIKTAVDALQSLFSAVKSVQISLNMCSGCDDRAQTNKNDSPNSAKTNAGVSGTKAAVVKKKKLKQTSEERGRMVRTVTCRDVKNAQKRPRLRESIGDSSEEAQIIEQPKKRKKLNKAKQVGEISAIMPNMSGATRCWTETKARNVRVRVKKICKI